MRTDVSCRICLHGIGSGRDYVESVKLVEFFAMSTDRAKRTHPGQPQTVSTLYKTRLPRPWRNSHKVLRSKE